MMVSLKNITRARPYLSRQCKETYILSQSKRILKCSKSKTCRSVFKRKRSLSIKNQKSRARSSKRQASKSRPQSKKNR